MDIYDYAKYPAKEDWLKISGDKIDSLDKLQIENSKKTFNTLDFDGSYHAIQLNYWLQEFNNKAFDLIANYTLLKSYYDAGIPDDEWFKSPGDNGQSVQYFPHFKEEHHGNLYWFGFYMDSYYTRFESLIDAIYHVINVKYQLNVEPSMGFRGKVLKQLETSDKDLYDYLKALPSNAIYKQINEYRNNIVHNYRPNQIDSGFTRTVGADGKQSFTMTVGSYTTSTEFLNNINASLDLLAEITDEIRDKVKQTK